MAILAALALAVVGALMADEIKTWLPTITQWLLNFAVKRLPLTERERRFEEWSADLQSFPEGTVKCLRAFDLSRASFGILWSYHDRELAGWITSQLRVWQLRFWLYLVHKTANRMQKRLKNFRSERGIADGSELTQEESRIFVEEYLSIERLILKKSTTGLEAYQKWQEERLRD
jgi:hypothetical protein